MHKYKKIKDVAAIFGVTPQTIRSLILRGELKAIRAGRMYLISEEEIQRFEKETEVKPLENNQLPTRQSLGVC